MDRRQAKILLMKTKIWGDDDIMDRIKNTVQHFKHHCDILEIPTMEEGHFGNLISSEDLQNINIAVITFEPSAVRLALDKLPNVEWLYCIYTGVDKIAADHSIVRELTERKVILTNSRGSAAKSLSEFSIAACLHFAKKFNTFEKWKREKTWLYTTTENLSQKTMLIVGLGHLGGATAKIAKNGFDMKVIGLKRTVTEPKMEFVDEVFEVSKLHEVLPRADFLVNCLPLTKETHHFFGKKEFAAMKPNAVFINVGRGANVDELALIQALREDKIYGAALDVFEQEPLNEDSPFYNDEKIREKTLISFHLGAESNEQHQAISDIFTQNLENFIAGKEMHNVVDLEKGY